MKIVHFVSGLSEADGGPSRSVPRLSLAQRQLGADVVLAYERGQSSISDETKDAASAGVTVKNVRTRGQRNDLIANADIVHLHGLWSFDVHSFSAAARFLHKPVVHSTRGMLEPWARSHRKLKKTIAWYSYQYRDLLCAALIHATSDLESQNVLEIIPSARMVTVPNGTDLPLFDKEAERKTQILFLSRLHEKKGALQLVEAVSRLASETIFRGWRVIIAGPDEGGHAAEVSRRITERKLDGIVSMVGSVDRIRKWVLLRESSLFVLPSFSENFGIVVAEALAAEVPVISTTGTPWRELRDRDCGWWVEPAMEPILAALRDAVCTPAAELLQKGRRGRALVEEKYSWPAAAARMLSAYTDVLRGNSQKP